MKKGSGETRKEEMSSIVNCIDIVKWLAIGKKDRTEK